MSFYTLDIIKKTLDENYPSQNKVSDFHFKVKGTVMSVITSLAAIIAILIFTGLGIFQLMLALGKPYGKAAYGGKYEVLPDNLRY